MSMQAPESAQFYLTASSPCPYLAGKQERKLFTHLAGRRAQGLHQLLADNGFRRSQNLVYRPSCEGCSACKSARVCVEQFVPKKRHQRLMKTNRDVESRIILPEATDEQFDLFSRYLAVRHEGGGMTQMSEDDFQDMVEDTPVSSSLVEYRLSQHSEQPGLLVAVALIDNMIDGYSMVYSFFDPKLNPRGLGNYMILDHIGRARRVGLSYVYLGYWVKDSAKMHYKSQFRPLQIQSAQGGWKYLE